MKKQLKRLAVVGVAAGMLATSILGVSAGGKFDAKWYAEQTPDVVKELGDSEELLRLHYEMFGKKEARMSNSNDVEAQLRRLFDAEEYAKFYPDVKEAFGDDVEAMFSHYIAFGLLEARRPSEQIPQSVAVSMKQTIEKAMADAGVAAVPGSAEVVKVITGDAETPADAAPGAVTSVAEAAVQQALVQVQEVVAKAITETVKEVQNPTPPPVETSSSDEPKHEQMSPELILEGKCGAAIAAIKPETFTKNDDDLKNEIKTAVEAAVGASVTVSGCNALVVTPAESGKKGSVTGTIELILGEAKKNLVLGNGNDEIKVEIKQLIIESVSPGEVTIEIAKGQLPATNEALATKIKTDIAASVGKLEGTTWLNETTPIKVGIKNNAELSVGKDTDDYAQNKDNLRENDVFTAVTLTSGMLEGAGGYTVGDTVQNVVIKVKVTN